MTTRLLIVDDEAQLVRNLAGYLGSFTGELDVVTAVSGEEGLEIVRADPPDVLVTDIRMPGMDGIELIRRSLRLRPQLKVLVMTAYGSAEIRDAALGEGALRFIEKPLDLEELRETVLEVAKSEHGWSARLGGLDIFDLAQLLAYSGRSKVIHVAHGREHGSLVFVEGNLVHAATAHHEGEPAFFEMTGWEGGEFEEARSEDPAAYPRTIQASTTHLMMEAARRHDEAAREASGEADDLPDDDAFPDLDLEPDAAGIGSTTPATAPPADEGASGIPSTKESQMAIKDHLQEFNQVAGFQAAAIFSASGEMIDSLSNGSVDIASVGQYANNALLNAQKATDQMGVGRGNLVQIRAPQALLMMRCLNEATDFAATNAGKAHFHGVVVLEAEGNAGMAGMVLDKVVGKIADELR